MSEARLRALSLSENGRLAWQLATRGSTVLHEGSRARTEVILQGRRVCIKKTFVAGWEGRESHRGELLAREIFGDRSWFAPIKDSGPDWLTRRFYWGGARLDRVATRLNEPQRLDAALQALSILGEIHMDGFAHCDFHAGNLYRIKGRLVVNDFEAIQPYPRGSRPPLPESYDITGKGLPSPHRTANMCYVHPHPKSLSQVLHIPLTRLLKEYEAHLKAQLRHACLSFETSEGRHRCRAGNIYGSFSLPHLTVYPSEAQRDSARRLERFGVSRETLEGKSVLDLGCNVGAMLLELQKFGPCRSLGVEHDVEKVRIARKISAYAGLNKVEFIQGDVDYLTAGDLGGPFKVVLCLAIEAHVKDPSRLYRLLADITSENLYFEGNAPTDPLLVRANLLESGFSHVEYIGMSDDDCLAENNNRPMFIAWR